MTDFIRELLVLCSIALLGTAAKKYHILDRTADAALTRLILYITLPALIIRSLDLPFTPALLQDFAWLIGISAWALGMAVLLAAVLGRSFPQPPNRQGVYQGLIIFGNQGFLGFALCSSLLPQEGIIYAAVFNLLFQAMIWTYGLFLVAGRQEQQPLYRSLFLNPGTIALSLGLLLFILPGNLPSLPARVLQQVGALTTPLAMLLIGSIIGNQDLVGIRSGLANYHLWTALTAKLIIVPLLLLPLVLLPVKPLVLTVALLLSAMPAAPTIPLFAEKYGADASFGSLVVCLTTLSSILSLPAIYGLLTIILG